MAQRRRLRTTNNEVGLTVTRSNSSTPLIPKAPAWPRPFPQDGFTLVLRPQGGLKLANVEMAEIYPALLNTINFTRRHANLKFSLDAMQNTATLSTPCSDAAKVLSNIKQLKIADTIYTVTLYGLAPDDSPQGLIERVPLRFN
ncbi:hypothetical protein HPB48_016308 [Haemaphysalis longicornis]|uniref:Uncharacterized protein n=1 Tax=Haemaphysalis longicornis TaxID=44386 RepID=A0A9J6FBH2_HAELO|nr:hypothetical protein HPB48_016308 [Haemaphysalis longicornis]